MGFFSKAITLPFRATGKMLKGAEYVGNKAIPKIASGTFKTVTGGVEIGIDEAVYYAGKLGKSAKNVGSNVIERVDNSKRWAGFQLKTPYSLEIHYLVSYSNLLLFQKSFLLCRHQ